MINNLRGLKEEKIASLSALYIEAAAESLSQIVGTKAAISDQVIEMAAGDRLKELFPPGSLVAKIELNEGFPGYQLMVLDSGSAAVIARIMLLEEASDKGELTDMHLSALEEAVGQLTGSGFRAVSSLLSRKVSFAPPDVKIGFSEQSLAAGEYLHLKVSLEAGNILQGRISLLFSPELVCELGTLPGWKEAEAMEGVQDAFAGKLNRMEEDTIKEVGNISLGSSATILSQLISRRVDITTPHLTYTTIAEIKARFPTPCLVVEVSYINGLVGKNLLVIEAKDAQIISRLMMQEDPQESVEMDEIHLSAVGEAMNQMMGSAATALSDMFDRKINISPPRVEFRDVELSLEEARLLEDDVERFAQVSFRIEVEGLIDSEIIQIIPLKFAREMTGYLLNRYQLEDDGDFEGEEENKPAPPESENDLWQDIAQETEESPGASAPGTGFAMFLEEGELGLVKDISVQIEGIIGTVRKPLSELLELNKGSVVEMDTTIGQPIDILANGKLVARAEIVAVREYFGLKLTEIVFK